MRWGHWAGDCGQFGAALRGSPEPDHAWQKQPLEQAVRAFDKGGGSDAEASREREIEKPHAPVGRKRL